MPLPITVLIPAFNEEECIACTVRGVKSTGIADRVLVVDDGSTDNTASAAQRVGAEVIRLNTNKGKGNALNTGILSIKSGVVVFIDGDTGQSSTEFYKLALPVLKGNADIAIGILPPPSVKGGLGIVKKTADIIMIKTAQRRLQAALSGQRAARRDVLSAIGPLSEGFAVEIGMNVRALTLGFKIMEIPVDMYHRESGRNLRGFLHRGRQLSDILKYYKDELRGNTLC